MMKSRDFLDQSKKDSSTCLLKIWIYILTANEKWTHVKLRHLGKDEDEETLTGDSSNYSLVSKMT